MSVFIEWNEKQKKIMLQIKSISELPITEARLNKFVNILINNKTIDQVCEVYMLKEYLKNNELYVYDKNDKLCNFDVIDHYYEQKNNKEKNSRWIKYTKIYKQSLAINLKHSHEWVKDVIKAFNNPKIGFSINTKKIN